MRDESDACWGGRNPTFKNEAQKLWMERMAARGWTVPDWPTEYGGGGLSPAETKILKQEMARIGARNPLMSFGISMLGPALLKYGNEEQKKLYLTQIAQGRDPLVPGLFRARRRLRPRFAADQVRGQGRSLAGQRPEGLDQLCRQGRLDLLPRPHRSARRPSIRASASSCSTWRARASRPSRSCSSPAIRPSARPSSTT